MKSHYRPECKLCRSLQVPAIKPVNPDFLSEIQLELFNGSMLGDGFLSFPERKNYNCYYKITRARKDKSYLEWQASHFIDFSKQRCISDSESFDKRTAKTYYSSNFRTRSCDVFTQKRCIWYQGRVKIVPKNLKLTPLAVAIWFCDDGCIYNTTSSFATDGFSFHEVCRLQKLLIRIVQEEFSVYPHENSFILRGGKLATQSLVEKIGPYIPSSMLRKLP